MKVTTAIDMLHKNIICGSYRRDAINYCIFGPP